MSKRTYRPVRDSAQLRELIDFLFDRRRTVAAIVVTYRHGGIGPCYSPLNLQEMVGDHAQVFLLSAQLNAAFNDLLQNIFGIIPSGIRIYKPHMQWRDHVARHTVMNEAKIAELTANRQLENEILWNVRPKPRKAASSPKKPLITPVKNRPRRPLLHITV